MSRGDKFKQWCNLVATFLVSTSRCYCLGSSHPLPIGWCQETSYAATTLSKYRQSARSPDTNTHFWWVINDVWEELLLLFFRSFGGRGPLKNESHWNTSQSLILPWWSSWSTIHCALTTKHSKQTGSSSNNIKHCELSLTARDHYSVSPHLLRPYFVAQPDRIINPIHTALCSCKEDQCWAHWSPCTRYCRCAAFIWKKKTYTVISLKRLHNDKKKPLYFM